MLFLKITNFCDMLQRQSDVVQSAYMTVLAERIDIETNNFTIMKADLLCRQVNSNLIAVRSVHIGKQTINNVRFEDNRQYTIFETIIAKNIRITRREHHTETVVQ